MARHDATAGRRKRLVRLFKGAGIDALLTTKPQNIRYLTGFRGDDSALLVTSERTSLLGDSRYVEEAADATVGISIITIKRGMLRTVADFVRRTDIAKLGVEGHVMTMADAQVLGEYLPKVNINPTTGLVEKLRIIKDASEIALIRKATEIAEDAFRLTVGKLAPGMTEFEIARILEQNMQDLGAEAPAFPTIVAAQERSSLPHAQPTRRRIRKGEAILFDWGARWNGYHSDLTRMAFLDRICPFFKGLYATVLEAQQRALAQIGPGRSAGKSDEAARKCLKIHRRNKHFGHSLGHGVGLEVHEAPGIRTGQDTVFRPGMVITVEPGVYLPGRGGVRIEDLVLVTRKGHLILTSLAKSSGAFLVSS